jgi:hypothetical protein
MHSSETVKFEQFLIRNTQEWFAAYMVSRYVALRSTAAKSEKWIYQTISEKLTPFHECKTSP